MSGISRVSIPENVHKTIQDIKEIAGNHSDDEIYAMLKECCMDPNETAQKLLLQDTFHEVRRKRDKRKENLNNREIPDSRWRPATQGRGGRVGRGSYTPRYNSHDVGGKNTSSGKENGVNQRPQSGVTPSSLPVTQETENKGMIHVSSSKTGMLNGPTNVGSSTQRRAFSPGKPADVGVNTPGSEVPPPSAPVEAKNSSSAVNITNITHGKHTPRSDHLSSPVSVLGVYSSASDPVLVPSLDSRLPGAVGTIKREVGSQRNVLESNSSIPAESKSTATPDLTKRLPTNKVVSRRVTNNELPSSMNEKAAPEHGNYFMHDNIPSSSQGNQVSDPLPPSTSSSQGGTSTSRPSSNYGSRSQHLIGSQKAVGPSKEWKPKPTVQNSTPAPVTAVASDVGPITVETAVCSLPNLNAPVCEVAKSKLQHKLEELQSSHSQHVIIPNHLQVPEAERTGLSFGSFDASFGLNTSYVNCPETDKSSTPLSESSQVVEEANEEPSSSNQDASPTAQEGEYPDQSESPTNVPENLSPVEADVPSGSVSEYDQSKSEGLVPVGAPQYSVVHTGTNYSFGLGQPILGPPFAYDGTEPQARDVARLSTFVVPSFDPSANLFSLRHTADGDGRFSPYLGASGAAAKYNGNVVSSQSGQPPQESANSLVLSTAGPTALVTQAAGVMQSALSVPQPPLHVFRPTVSHYPPSYFPFNQYNFPNPYVYSYPFLGNAAFPQQPPGNIYQPSAAGAAPAVKYSLPQYKPGTNTGNSTHVGSPAGYVSYNSSQAGYNTNPSVTAGNSTGNDDLSASQFKENNVYMTGPQSESSPVWINAGREVSGLPNSFYNLPPQAPHLTYAPTQPGHGPYAGMYHTAQTMAAAPGHPLLQQSQTMPGPAEMVGAPTALYQQPQRPQINWTGTYN